MSNEAPLGDHLLGIGSVLSDSLRSTTSLFGLTRLKMYAASARRIDREH